MNSATCVAKYEDDDYQCACAPGHVGKHCEIGNLCHEFLYAFRRLTEVLWQQKCYKKSIFERKCVTLPSNIRLFFRSVARRGARVVYNFVK